MYVNKNIKLDHASNYKIDSLFHIGTIPHYATLINLENIIKITLKNTIYDRINNQYYVLTFVNGKKIYVNERYMDRIYFGNVRYGINSDFRLIESLVNGD